MNFPVKSRQVSPYLLLILTTFFWSGNFILGRAVRDAFSPVALSFWRWTIALLILLPFTWVGVRGQWSSIRRHWASLTLLAVLGIDIFNTFVYVGLQSTTATNAVIMMSTTPVIIVGLSYFLLKITVTRWQGLGITVSLLGVLVIVTRGDLTTLLVQRFNQGDAWMLMAVLCWALYSVCLNWRPAALDSLVFLTTTIGIGVAFLAPVYVWDIAVNGAILDITPITLSSIAYVAVFPSVLAFIFWNLGVAELGANRTGQFIHLMPAFGVVLAFVFLGERLYGFHWLGIGLIAVGIYLATMWRR